MGFRAGLLAIVVAAACSACWSQRPAGHAPPEPHRIPVIDVTDLYHPYQDPGDNFDLLTAYALPEIDLRAVVLDATGMFRKPVAEEAGPGLWKDDQGPRDPGFIPVLQLDYLFGRRTPVAAGPFSRMKSPSDRMGDVPGFQQQGIALILDTLRASREKVHILSFGSARAVAAAFNRDPALFRRKVARIHLSAGSTGPEFLEWNVALDPNAIVCLLTSGLPIDLYPCATKDGPFSMDRHNTYWQLPDLRFARRLDPRLQRYVDYAFGRVQRNDFLRAMDSDLPRELNNARFGQPHHVWETAIWMNVAGLRLVRQADGKYRLKREREILPTEKVVRQALEPCSIHVPDDGRFVLGWSARPGKNIRAFVRDDPDEYQRGLREALPALYESFRP